MADTIKKFWLVAKPGIIAGNLITAAGGFFLASKGHRNCAFVADDHRHSACRRFRLRYQQLP
jgi:heme O synthase-like polyprenyltransferase